MQNFASSCKITVEDGEGWEPSPLWPMRDYGTTAKEALARLTTGPPAEDVYARARLNLIRLVPSRSRLVDCVARGVDELYALCREALLGVELLTICPPSDLSEFLEEVRYIHRMAGRASDWGRRHLYSTYRLSMLLLRERRHPMLDELVAEILDESDPFCLWEVSRRSRRRLRRILGPYLSVASGCRLDWNLLELRDSALELALLCERLASGHVFERVEAGEILYDIFYEAGVHARLHLLGMPENAEEGGLLKDCERLHAALIRVQGKTSDSSPAS